PGLVARAMFERNAEAGQAVDFGIQVVAFEIDGRRRSDRFLRIGLDRQGGAAARLEPRVGVFRAIDYLLQTQRAIESDRRRVIVDRERHLVEAWCARWADVKANIGLSHRTSAVPEVRRGMQR